MRCVDVGSDPILVTPYVLAYGAYAVLCGLLIGLLLRASALIVLKLTESQTEIKLAVQGR